MARLHKKNDGRRSKKIAEICQKKYKKTLTSRQESDKILRIKSLKQLRKKVLAMLPGIITTQAAVRIDLSLSPNKSVNVVNVAQVCDVAENECTCARRIKMIKTTDAVEYLVELYKNTSNSKGKHYACSNVKLGKLLTLASFLQACISDNNDTQLLDENIIALSCGMTINNIDFIVIDYQGEIDECSAIKPEQISDVQCGLDKEIKKLLHFVFENFGAFSQRKLGLYLDEYRPDGIKAYDIVTIDANLISLLKNSSIGGNVCNNLSAFSEYIERYRTQVNGNRPTEESN